MGCLLLLICLFAFLMAEFALMGRVSAEIGVGDTLVLLILSAVFGSYFARHQGKVVLSRIQQSMAGGQAPTVEMVDGLLVFLGGGFFIFPGFISDIIGLVLIFPLTRWLVRLLAMLAFQMQQHRAPRRPSPAPQDDRPGPSGGIDRDKAVDAEVVE